MNAKYDFNDIDIKGHAFSNIIGKNLQITVQFQRGSGNHTEVILVMVNGALHLSITIT